VNKATIFNQIINYSKLLRWNKPSGRIILLIPAGWSLWLTPSAPPTLELVLIILLGGICTSGAGCIANDLWDMNIDKKVLRTKSRPLASGIVSVSTAWILLIITLILSLVVVIKLPLLSREICLKLALIALFPILIYPSSKRWFKYPQAILAICWGFSTLIPWAASEASLNGGLPLLFCWLATIVWAFGFDTVYAMSDMDDDKKLGINSSALNLKKNIYSVVSTCYGSTSILIALAALKSSIGLIFWPIWLTSSLGMQKEIFRLKKNEKNIAIFNSHFQNQVLLGGLILLALVLGKIN
tara:strand:- start:30 stop:923 length:894 start_codon:yes stop_codon:yes gene_type:complete